MKEENPYPDIRLARHEDITYLVDICRKSFPDRAIWQASRSRAKKMWEAILSWKNNETWVCSINSCISGFILLVFDFASFDQEWLKQRKNFLPVKVYACVMSPRFLFNKIWKKMFSYYRRFKNNKISLDKTDFFRKNNLWISILAVTPEMRNRGIAKKMINLSRERANEFGKEAIILKVDIRNRPARNLYEKMKFINTCSDFEYCYYITKANGKS